MSPLSNSSLTWSKAQNSCSLIPNCLALSLTHPDFISLFMFYLSIDHAVQTDDGWSCDTPTNDCTALHTVQRPHINLLCCGYHGGGGPYGGHYLHLRRNVDD